MSSEIYFSVLCGLLIVGAGVWIVRRSMRATPTVTSRRRIATAVADLAKAPDGASRRADALILGDIANPLIEITAIHTAVDAAPLHMSPAMRTALQPLIQRAPEMLRVGTEVATKTYRVVFSPTVTRALKDGTLELLPSSEQLLPVARDLGKGKKFVEIGRVVKGGGVRLASVAAMSWQIASIVTAQHYLDEINARLAGIERGIDDIRTWLEEEKKGELRAAVHLLREYYSAIARGDLHAHEQSAIYHQLDDIERTCLSIGELAREMSRRRLEELDKLDVREWTDRGGSADRALKWVKHNREALDLISLAQSVRILVCQVKATLPGDRQRLHDRIEHAKQEVIEAQHLFESTREVLDAKVQELAKRKGSFFALGGILDEDYRHKINTEYSCAREHTAQSVEKLRRESASALDFSSRFHALDTAGLALDVRVNQDGEIDILSANPTTA
jgi:hypothetical protein